MYPNEYGRARGELTFSDTDDFWVLIRPKLPIADPSIRTATFAVYSQSMSRRKCHHT